MLSTDGGAVGAALPDQLPGGAKAGPWVVEKELGRGGMGSVYAVVHEDIGKRAALKVMHRHLVTESSAERILLEARVVNQVGHPNIVDIFETGTLADGRPFIVMERLDGVSLAQRAGEAKLLPDQVIAILLHICDALAAAHAAGVIHRDLKLDNVFLIDNPEIPTQPGVKLLDWGIAKMMTPDGVRNTIEGQLVGTPQYLSPEQARGADVSPQTDVYSLGVMAYQLFLEQLPFEAETAAEVMVMHLRCLPPPPRELWPDIPASLEQLLFGMLAKQPESRPTIAIVAHTLELVRAELVQRRESLDETGATPAPEHARITRWSSAPGLAPTQIANTPHARRWMYALTTLVLAACAMSWFVRHDVPRASAMVMPIAIETPAIPHRQAVVRVESPPASIVVAPVHHTSRPSAPRKAPGTPHRSAGVDPDGTIDPYK